jgi:hypothetical protein
MRTLRWLFQYNALGGLYAKRGIYMEFAKIQQIVADNPFTLFLILILLLLADGTGTGTAKKAPKGKRN